MLARRSALRNEVPKGLNAFMFMYLRYLQKLANLASAFLRPRSFCHGPRHSPSYRNFSTYPRLHRSLPLRGNAAMRLINTVAHQLAGPFIGTNIPRYAILSHTWSQEELSLQDMSDFHQHKKKRGYQRVRSCCRRAIKDAHTYVWVDTVCTI